MSMNTWQPTGFSAGEFARMQQDAERRVEEMRRRARQSTGEPEHTYSAPVRTIQPGEGITLPLAAALAWLLAENTLQACPIAPLVKTLRLSLPLAVLAGACYNFCVYFAAEPQLMGQNPALYENVSRLVQFWL